MGSMKRYLNCSGRVLEAKKYVITFDDAVLNKRRITDRSPWIFSVLSGSRQTWNDTSIQ